MAAERRHRRFVRCVAIRNFVRKFYQSQWANIVSPCLRSANYWNLCRKNRGDGTRWVWGKREFSWKSFADNFALFYLCFSCTVPCCVSLYYILKFLYIRSLYVLACLWWFSLQLDYWFLPTFVILRVLSDDSTRVKRYEYIESAWLVLFLE